jgi:hypothetical protein
MPKNMPRVVDHATNLQLNRSELALFALAHKSCNGVPKSMPRVVDHATNLQLKYVGVQAWRPSTSNLGGTSHLSSLIAPPVVNSALALRSGITLTVGDRIPQRLVFDFVSFDTVKQLSHSTLPTQGLKN